VSITDVRSDAQGDDRRKAWPSRLSDLSDLSPTDLGASAGPSPARSNGRPAESLSDPGTASAGSTSAL
jgi:hypothetical protein